MSHLAATLNESFLTSYESSRRPAVRAIAWLEKVGPPIARRQQIQRDALRGMVGDALRLQLTGLQRRPSLEVSVVAGKERTSTSFAAGRRVPARPPSPFRERKPGADGQ
jgi:hypothetical protein